MSVKIGLFFGTDTGNTEMVAGKLKDKIESLTSGNATVDIMEIYKKEPKDLEQYEYLIIGMPTWYDGELQGDWEAFLPKWENVHFQGKHLAFFGLGDQYGYSFYFCDALGIFYKIAKDAGAIVCGETDTDGYEYDASKAEIDGKLCGLCIDVDNQDELTDERIDKWVPEVLKGFGIQ